MLKITYEYKCDICKDEIRPPEEYEMAPWIAAQDTALPKPRTAFAVGEWHVCYQCLCEARNVLKARMPNVKLRGSEAVPLE